MDVFIHHNTLHAFEHLPFEAAVEHVGQVNDAEPYLRHGEYLAAWDSGRIEDCDVKWAVEQVESKAETHLFGAQLPRLSFWRALLRTPARQLSWQSVRWFLEEGRGLHRFADDVEAGARLALLAGEGLGHLHSPPVEAALRALWTAVIQRVGGVSLPAVEPVTGSVTASRASELDALTISLIAAYLDRGTARWPLPGREQGFLTAVLTLVRTGEATLPEPLRWLSNEQVQATWLNSPGEIEALDVVARLLDERGLPPDDWPAAVRTELAGVSGWCGLASVLEQTPKLRGPKIGPVTLADLVAVRLLLAASAPVAAVSDAANFTGSTDERAGLAYQLFLILQRLGLGAERVLRSTAAEFEAFALEVAGCGGVQRRRLLHQAYERRFQRQILAALTARHAAGAPRAVERPAVQAVFCLDEREESFRRHLEEQAPDCETFGAAGFFNVAMSFAPADGSAPVPLCPVVVEPRHLVREELEKAPHSRSRIVRRCTALFHWLAHGVYQSSRRLVLGQALAAGGGGFAALPLWFRVLMPRSTSRWAAYVAGLAETSRTRLLYVAESGASQSPSDGLVLGFTELEMADRVEGLLRSAGMAERLARLVFLLGHGSHTTNNPFASAYNCGACGGRRGHRNGRVFARMANDPDVRRRLAARGLTIPADTHFIGGCHDTCSDAVDLYDLESVPASHAADLAKARAALDQARTANAEERVRRFDDARKLRGAAALRHVEARSASLREPRPEFGHGSNASCIVGRRELTRGLSSTGGPFWSPTIRRPIRKATS
jgi:uncharacterized protein YbcC (UPF0753/DUF2309 family)